jgi:hypothetical protein
MKKYFIFTISIIFIISAVSFWSIVSKGYDRQNKIILTIKKIIPPNLAKNIKNTIFYIPNLKEKNKSLNLQLKKYEQGLDGQLFKEEELLTKKGKKYNINEFFLPFPRLDLSLGWAGKENSKRAHYLEIIGDKVIVISGLGQTIYFDKKNITLKKLSQNNIPNNIKYLLKNENYELIGIRDLFYEDNYIYISLLHKEKKGITINVYRAEYNLEKLNFEIFFEINEHWPKYNVFTGGRIETFRDNKILFSVGFSANYYKPQKKNSFLGKIITIDKKTKKSELVSFGHRNPQGLFFSNKNNLIINTEHGPYGGDEINFNFLQNKVIEKNFGWPISSEGKPYPGTKTTIFDENNWLQKTHEENGFIAPIRSYSPAIGISETVYIEENQRKTLYVSSLRAGSIYILDLNDGLKKILSEDRLFFKEQRIRDLEFDKETNSFFALFEFTPSIAIIKKIN